MTDQLSPQQQAEKIQALREAGKSSAEIQRDHPELAAGWDVLVGSLPPRGGGSTSEPPTLSLPRLHES